MYYRFKCTSRTDAALPDGFNPPSALPDGVLHFYWGMESDGSPGLVPRWPDRSVTLQPILASPTQMRAIVNDAYQQTFYNPSYSEFRARPHTITAEQSAYTYHLLDDNCTTRIADILSEYGAISPTPTLSSERTHRDWIHDHTAHREWLTFGMDLLLGRHTDAPMTHIGLPIQLKQHATELGIPAGIIQEGPEIDALHASKAPSPFIVFAIIAAVLALCQWRAKFTLPYWRGLILCALSGIALIQLPITLLSHRIELQHNLNLLWSLPALGFILAAIINRKHKPSALGLRYLCASALILTLFAWAWLPQAMPTAGIPLTLMLLWAGTWKKPSLEAKTEHA